MAFTPEQLKEITDHIASNDDLLEKLVTPLVNEKISRFAQTQQKELKAFKQEFGSVQESLNEITEKVSGIDLSDDALKNRFLALVPELLQDDDDDNGDDTVPDAEVAKLRAEIQQYQEMSAKEKQTFIAQLEEMKKTTAAKEARAQELEAQSKQAIAKSNAIRELSGQVIPGKEDRAFNLLLAEGKLTYNPETGAYGFEAPGEYGVGKVFNAITKEAIAPIITTEFPEFVAARGGGGSGASLSGQQQSSKRFNYEKITEAEIASMSADDRAEFRKGLMGLSQ
jgi:hypothetical protein